MEVIEWSRLIATLLPASDSSSESELSAADSKTFSTLSGHSFNPLENRSTAKCLKIFVRPSLSLKGCPDHRRGYHLRYTGPNQLSAEGTKDIFYSCENGRVSRFNSGDLAGKCADFNSQQKIALRAENNCSSILLFIWAEIQKSG